MIACDVACSWLRIVEPELTAVSLDDAKDHCEITDDAQDAKVERWIKAATGLAESQLNRGLLTQTYRFVLDEFANEMVLPMAAPLQSVTSVKYYNSDGTQQTLATTYYRVDTDSQPGRVLLKPAQSWPAVQCERGQAVEIVYVCGWTAAELVPDAIKHGILLLVGAYSEQREAVTDIQTSPLAIGVDALWAGHQVYWRQPVR